MAQIQVDEAAYQAQIFSPVILPFFATVAVAIRLWLRQKFQYALKADDYIILAVLPISWAIWGTACWTQLLGNTNGYFEQPLGQQENYWKSLFAVFLLFPLLTQAIRVAILIFYLRAFGTSRTSKTIIWIILIANTLFTGARLGALLGECKPTSTWWQDHSKCSASPFWRDYILAVESVGTAAELAILVFPVSFVLALKVPLSTRLGICSVFMFGLAACAASAWRLYIVAVYMTSSQKLTASVSVSNMLLTQAIEMDCGLICASLAASRNPLMRQIGIWKTKLVSLRVGETTLNEVSSASSPTLRAAKPKSGAGAAELQISEIQIDDEVGNMCSACGEDGRDDQEHWCAPVTTLELKGGSRC